jgi:hypothetical protein
MASIDSLAPARSPFGLRLWRSLPSGSIPAGNGLCGLCKVSAPIGKRTSFLGFDRFARSRLPNVLRTSSMSLDFRWDGLERTRGVGLPYKCLVFLTIWRRNFCRPTVAFSYKFLAFKRM